MKATIEQIKCKHCGSQNVIRFGYYKDIPRFFCKDCKRKWADNGSILPKYKTPTEQITLALSSFYTGQSLNDVKEEIEQHNPNTISESAVYYWVLQQSRKLIDATKDYKAKTSSEWLGDEIQIKVGGKKFWISDILDKQTRFLLSSRLSKTRNLQDVQAAIQEARDKSSNIPKIITTDGLPSYPDAVERVFGSETKHVRSSPFTDADHSTNRVEREQGSYRDFYKNLRGIKTKETAETLIHGWQSYYNYLRSHDSLDSKTPAEVAGITYPYKNWAEFVNQSTPKTIVKVAISKPQRLPVPRVRLPSTRAKLPRNNVRLLAPNGMVYQKGSLLSRRHFKGSRLRRIS